ncbi:GLABROUS1 enhancer-binding protein-like 3 isoform X2 [Eutrema salsugineum]|uniref:GLABROUS1 enhancer-binding protein-like 3 isoform X2 n=1 Tax=Eutrema salsugineum TaxID=72664 RepID=UPI000CED7F0D|nr:GLABROUS1 enhancer-binding protein-like 3 isoform X2 [Eutrema salsugineum]
MVDSSDSNTDCFEIRHRKSKTMKRKHDNDDDGEDISGTKAMLRRRKRPKKTMMSFVSSPQSPKMIWTKSNELEIVRGIVDYEKEKGLSYGSDSDAFYGYVKDLIDADFSKQQLMNKVRKMKKRFTDNHGRSKNVKRSFANSDEEELFEFSTIIWGKKNETESASNENMQDQASKDVSPCAENDAESGKKNDTECASNENMQDQVPKDVPPCAVNETEGASNENMQDQVPKDVHPCAENGTECGKKNETEGASNENMQDQVPKGSHTRMENEKRSVDDDISGLQDAFETMAFFKALSENQQRLLRRGLRNIPAQRRIELTNEWKELLEEEMKLSIKKMAFSVKLATAGVSA